MGKQKFKIGDKAVAKVKREGKYNSVCDKGETVRIDKIEKTKHAYFYTCGINEYVFRQDELRRK